MVRELEPQKIHLLQTDKNFLAKAIRIGQITKGIATKGIPSLERKAERTARQIAVEESQQEVAEIQRLTAEGFLPDKALTRAQRILDGLKGQKPSSTQDITVPQEPLSLTQTAAIVEISLLDNRLDLSQIDSLKGRQRKFMDLLVQTLREGKQASAQDFSPIFEDGETVSEKILQRRITGLVYLLNQKLEKIIVVNTQGRGGNKRHIQKSAYFIAARETIRDPSENRPAGTMCNVQCEITLPDGKSIRISKRSSKILEKLITAVREGKQFVRHKELVGVEFVSQTPLQTNRQLSSHIGTINKKLRSQTVWIIESKTTPERRGKGKGGGYALLKREGSLGEESKQPATSRRVEKKVPQPKKEAKTKEEIKEEIKKETSLQLALKILTAINKAELRKLSGNLRINILDSLPLGTKFTDIFKVTTSGVVAEQDVKTFFTEAINTGLHYWSLKHTDLKPDASIQEKMLVALFTRLRLLPLSPYTPEKVRREVQRHFDVPINANNANNITLIPGISNSTLHPLRS